jgi:hypothetical protein
MAGSASASLIATCDPALYGLATAFQAICRTKLDAAWQAATTTSEVGGTQKFNTHVVEGLYFKELGPEFAKWQWRWPALTMWRESEKWSQRTAVWDECEATVRGAYVLPPLTHEMFDRLQPIRHAVIAAIRAAIENKGDPSYSAGTNILEAQNIEWCWLTDTEYGSYASEVGTHSEHPAVRFVLNLREREMPNSTSVVDMTQAESTIQVADNTLGNVDLVETQFTP